MCFHSLGRPLKLGKIKKRNLLANPFTGSGFSNSFNAASGNQLAHGEYSLILNFTVLINIRSVFQMR